MLRRYKSQRKAARVLGLANNAQLGQMLSGTLRDTPPMKAALKRANDRARRAWRMARPQSEGAPVVDVAAVQTIREELRQLLRRIDSIIPK